MPILEQTEDYDLFVVATNDGGDKDIGGTVFQDLLISYAGSGTAGNSAVKVTNRSQSIRLYRVTLLNWPTGVKLEHSYRASVIDCIDHAVTGTSYATIGLQLGDGGSSADAVETYVAGCLFLDDSHLGTAVQVYGCEHLRMSNCRLDGWQQGILFTPTASSGSAKKVHFADVSCFTKSSSSTIGAAVFIQTAGGTSTSPRYVAHVTFANCEFGPAASGTSYIGPGVNVEPGSGVGNAVDGIRFLDCRSCLWNGAGLNVTGGTNIEILGGHYSVNGVGGGTGSSSAGIALTGAVSGMRISGAACNNSFYNVDAGPAAYAPSTQDYGVYVSAGASSVRLQGCDLTNNLSSAIAVDGSSSAPVDIFVRHCDCTGSSTAVQVTTPVTNLQITDCPGYNDQGTSSTTLPSGTFYNTSFSYYGPMVCYVWPGSRPALITVDGHATSLASGAFTLGPGESAAVSGSPNFLAVGK